MSQSWYADFFHGIVVEMWRNAAPLEYTLAEVDFLEKHLQLSGGNSVLDIPCGFGRHSLELARRGHRVTGVDVSEDMLAEARRLADAAQLQVEWRRAEMRALSDRQSFDAAFCFGNSFGYLNRDETFEFLQTVQHALRPGGRFAFDYGMAAECILPRFIPQQWARIDEMYFLEENTYHLDDSCIETRYTFIRNGEEEQRTGLHYVYTVAEVQAMLEECNLQVVSLFAGVDESPFQLASPLLVVVAEKAAAASGTDAEPEA